MLSIRSVLICALVVTLPTYAWSQSRHIDIKAEDERERPLIDATVMVSMVPTPPKFPGDEVPWSEGAAALRLFAKTDASGAAIIDVSEFEAVAPNQPLRVTVWKKGYGPETVSAQKQARLHCSPAIKRRFQIVDSDWRPMAGLKVQQLPAEPVVADDQAKMVWWTDEEARTNEFGVVALDSHANGSVWFEITGADGVLHHVKQSNVRVEGTQIEPRDLLVVRLSRYGKIEGQMPASFATDFVARLIPKFSITRRPPENSTRFDLSVKLQADGKFTVDAVPEGDYWLVVRPKPSSDLTRSAQLGKAPQAQQPIQIVADQIVALTVSSVSLAKVTGRLTTSTSAADFSAAQVNILQALPGELINLSPRPAYMVAPCAANGDFECWLPPGRYELGCVPGSLWKADKPLSIEVGEGAATLAAGQMQVSRTQSVQVAWQSEHRWPRYLQKHSDQNLVFSFKGDYRVLSSLTQDGYAQIFAPVGERTPKIHQNISNVINPRPSTVSVFEDTDPSENYQLELVSEPRGLATNISIRGRVVDTLGNAVANALVNIALNYNLKTQGGMRTLERVFTESDGSFQIPPRQLLEDVMRSEPQGLLNGQFTFSAFVLANPEPVEVQKVITFDSQAWELQEVEFPNIVLQPPAAPKTLNLQLLSADGQPAAGEFVQLADQRQLIGAISDRGGHLSIEGLTGPTWLLRSNDWSIHKIDTYEQAVSIAFDSGANARQPPTLRQRMPKEQRQALAQKVLAAVPKGGSPTYPVSHRCLPLSDQQYLSPDESFQDLLNAAGELGDKQRLQYVKFWNKLGDDKLEKVVVAMQSDMARVELLRFVADRQPSAEAYARAMDAVPLARHPLDYRFSQGETFQHIAEIGLKLHHLGRLDPHRDKIRRFVAEWKSVPPKMIGGRAAISNNERRYGPVCAALADPALFARETLELLSKDSTELTNEERSQQHSQAELFVRLFPNDYKQLSSQHVRMAFAQETMISWGEQSPFSALEAYKLGAIASSQLRRAAESSLLCRHAEAGSMVRDANKLLVRFESSRPQLLDDPAEVDLYRAAQSIAPELGRQQAWLMARDYLSGRYEFSGMHSLPTQDQFADRTLAVAYCLSDEHPQLAEQIVQLGVPRVLQYFERKFEEGDIYWMDLTFAARFEPQAACDLLIRLSERYSDAMQKQNGQPAVQSDSRDVRLRNMTQHLAALRHSCLRGLLLDDF